MIRTWTIPLAAALVLVAVPIPANAGGYVGIEISNHGVSLGFGASSWGIWGSSWHSGGTSIGFSAALSGYGDWVHVGGLGRVWRPWVAAGWQPYTHGRWTWTSLGWTWVAYEPWGWIPHHYGNWAFSTVGWVWTPGYAYHPGNVVWVSTGVHVGWYPCAPRGWSHAHRGYHRGWHDGYGVGRRDGYSHGYADGWRDARYATWVPRSHVTAENIAHHSVGHEAATRAVARTSVTTMTGAPTRNQVESFVGRPVPEARIVERKATIDGREVRMVRPEGQERIVRRHGSSTVDRALNSKARRAVSSGSVASRGRPVSADVESARLTRPTAAGIETRGTAGHHARSSGPPSAARSARPHTREAVPAQRTSSRSEPRPQHRERPISVVPSRSTGRAQSKATQTGHTRTPRSSASPTRTVAKATPQQPEAPEAQSKRSGGGAAEKSRARSGVRQREPKKNPDPADKKTSKRSRSRD